MSEKCLRSQAAFDESDQESDSDSEYNDPSPLARSRLRPQKHQEIGNGNYSMGEPVLLIENPVVDNRSEDKIPPLRKLAHIGSLKMSKGDKRFSLGMNSAIAQDLDPRDEHRSRSDDKDGELSAFAKQYGASLQADNYNASPDSPNVVDNYRSPSSFRCDPPVINSTPNPYANKTSGSPPSSNRAMHLEPSASQGGQEFPTPSSAFRLKQNPPLLSTSRASQTPSRPNDMGLKNLSISDDDNDEEDNLSTASGGSVVRWHPYAQPQGSSPQDGRSLAGSPRSLSPHYCLPSYAASDSDSSSDSASIDPNLILNADVTMAIARDAPNQMKLKKATILHYTPGEDYKMTANPRGICLIINNVDFEAEIFPTRKGSDQDAKRFDELFTDLGFHVILRRNQTADQMRDSFSSVASQCKLEHDALFVMIFSHGNEYGIYGTDGIEVNLDEEIISRFDNRSCKVMIGKPKVFVIQACRGRSKDCGGDGDTTDSIAWPPANTTDPNVMSASQENQTLHSWLPRFKPSNDKKLKHPVRSDMLIIYSCLAGYVSVRNELAGSWMGVALAYFIIKHAHDKDLHKILNLVTSDISQQESDHGLIQTMERKYLGWTKNLYFNPGIYQ